MRSKYLLAAKLRHRASKRERRQRWRKALQGRPHEWFAYRNLLAIVVKQQTAEHIRYDDLVSVLRCKSTYVHERLLALSTYGLVTIWHTEEHILIRVNDLPEKIPAIAVGRAVGSDRITELLSTFVTTGHKMLHKRVRLVRGKDQKLASALLEQFKDGELNEEIREYFRGVRKTNEPYSFGRFYAAIPTLQSRLAAGDEIIRKHNEAVRRKTPEEVATRRKEAEEGRREDLAYARREAAKRKARKR